MKVKMRKSTVWIFGVLAFMLVLMNPWLMIKAKAATLSYDEIMAKITEQKNKFPQGKYWNHYGSSTNNPQGWTNTPSPVQDTSKPWTHTDSCCNHYEGSYGGRQCMVIVRLNGQILCRKMNWRRWLQLIIVHRK